MTALAQQVPGSADGGTGHDPSVARALAQASLAAGSKSFALAGKLLPRRVREDATVLYAWCRRADDAIDLVGPDRAGAALRALRDELESVYRGDAQADPLLDAFQELTRRRQVPRVYPEALLDGFAMDVEGALYEDAPDLNLYCFRVAGVVGLMMCHVMGLRDDRALVNATELGIAMQMTNICRDVEEDWDRRRLYLPGAWLPSAAPQPQTGFIPDSMRQAIQVAVVRLLADADTRYRRGDAGLWALSFRCALAIRAARLVYSQIGRLIQAQPERIWGRRVVVSRVRKLGLLVKAFALSVFTWPALRLRHRRHWEPLRLPSRIMRYPDDFADR